MERPGPVPERRRVVVDGAAGPSPDLVIRQGSAGSVHYHSPVPKAAANALRIAVSLGLAASPPLALLPEPRPRGAGEDPLGRPPGLARARARDHPRELPPPLLALDAAPPPRPARLAARGLLGDLHRVRGVRPPPGPGRRDRPAGGPLAPDRPPLRARPRLDRRGAAHRPRRGRPPLRRLRRRRLGAGGPLRGGHGGSSSSGAPRSSSARRRSSSSPASASSPPGRTWPTGSSARSSAGSRPGSPPASSRSCARSSAVSPRSARAATWPSWRLLARHVAPERPPVPRGGAGVRRRSCPSRRSSSS